MADISSLGIGSGVLTADVIDQLKEADESVIIKPIENKIELNKQKQDAEELLTSLMKSFKVSASALSYDTIFDNKTVDITGNSEVTVDAGATVESFSLETVTLAKKDITSFGALGDKDTTPVASGAGTLTIGSYAIDYDETMTLEDLAQAITDTAGATISASILQTGNGSYNLIVSSKSTGASEALVITDDSGLLDPALLNPYDAITNPNGYQKVQVAADAEFKYNGITVVRPTNDIDDLILGVNITLKEEGDISNVEIGQDTSNIVDELQLFVDSYNTLMQNLSDMTLKDEESGAEGVFNSSSFVKSISRDLTRAITSLSGGDSLLNYGLDLDRYGTLTLDKTILETKLKDDPDAVKMFFTGGIDTDGNNTTGIFESIDDKLNSYTGYGNLLNSFQAELETESNSLNDSYLRARKSLDARYDIMTQRFIAYDAMISKLNSQFSSLQMMIDADNNNS